MAYYVPYVIEQTTHGERSYDIYSRMLKDRIIFVGTEINDQVANSIIAQLLFLESDDADKEISMYINSPGGVVSAGLGIYDTMQFIKPEISTFCVGQAASMGAVLLAAGSENKRYCLPNSRVMIHQPLGGARGQASDIQIQAKEILRIKEKLNDILANHTKQDREKIAHDTDRDFWMTADEALNYGLVDKIVASHSATE